MAAEHRRTDRARGAAPAPAGFDAAALFDGITWSQRWEVFAGIFTPSGHSIKRLCADLELPADLSGRRVLDIGAWHGCTSFECERRGAREVVAIGPEDPAQMGFLRLRDALGSTRTTYRVGSVYDLDPAVLGRFDLVLFCGVLYHLRYPLLGIDNIRRVATRDVLIETYVTDAPPLLPLRALRSRQKRDLPLWRFFRGSELNDDASNWFGPNAEAVEQAFESAGFSIRRLCMGTVTRRSRATFAATVRPGPPEFFVVGSTEGIYFDHVVGHLLGPAQQWLDEDGSLVWTLANALASNDHWKGDSRTWVGSVYRRVLGRAPETAEVDRVVQRLALGEPAERRAWVIELARGEEAQLRVIARCYTHFLRRSGGPAEIDGWVKVLRTWRLDGVVVAFVCSPEYGLRSRSEREWFENAYGDMSGDATELPHVAPALDDGTASRQAIAADLVRRPECQHHLAAILYPADD